MLKDAQDATAAASSVHVAGTGTSSGKPFSLDVVAARGTGGGAVGESGATLQVILAGGKVYVKGDAQSLEKLTNSAAAGTLLGGRWLFTSASNPDFSDIANFVDISKLPQQITPQGTISVGAPTKVNDVAVISLNDSTGGRLYVATSGKPYIIAIRGSGANSGLLNFTEYNSARPPTAPANAINLDQLNQASG